MVYVGYKNSLIAQNTLQNLVEKTNTYYREWNLSINHYKCEIIIYFHPPLRFISPHRRIPIKNLRILYRDKDTDITHEIQRKYVVNYLEIFLNYLLKFNIHILTQLEKSSNSFKGYHRSFLNKNIEAWAKVILYLTLICPIFTYAAPIWWSFSASMAEKLCKFERSCLRVALNKFRTPESEFTQYHSNETLYNLAQIPRIDLFIIQFTREYIANTKDSSNAIVKSFAIQ